jgi:hypothetical protein
MENVIGEEGIDGLLKLNKLPITHKIYIFFLL